MLITSLNVTSVDLKKCCKCRVMLPRDKFTPDYTKLDGLRYDCKDCRNKLRRERRKCDPSKFLEYEHKPEVKAKQFAAMLKRQYHLTVEQFESMKKTQNNLCLICKQPEQHKTKKNLSIDHCHKTAVVRGLLCHRCNVVLGLVKEDFEVIENLKKYLRGELK
jgi:hypothetical protein